MNYDQLFGFIAGLYRISGNTLDQLQKTFLVTLLAVAIAFFASNLIVSDPQSGLFNLTYLISLSLIGLAFALTIPFQLASIKTSLDHKKQISLTETLSAPAISEYMIFFVAILGIAALALLPYAVAYKLVSVDLDNIQSTSNILLAIRMATLVAGLTALTYAVCKLIGSLVYYQNGNNFSLSDVFKKSQGHFIATLTVIVAMIVPVEIITQFIIHNIDGLKNIMSSSIVDISVLILQSFIRSIAFLLQIYYLMSGLTTYMKTVKLI